MQGSISFTLDVSSVPKLTAIRALLATQLEDQDCTVLSHHQAADTTEYTVVGVDTKDGSVFTQQVDAADQDTALEAVRTDTLIPTGAEPTT